MVGNRFIDLGTIDSARASIEPNHAPRKPTTAYGFHIQSIRWQGVFASGIGDRQSRWLVLCTMAAPGTFNRMWPPSKGYTVNL